MIPCHCHFAGARLLACNYKQKDLAHNSLLALLKHSIHLLTARLTLYCQRPEESSRVPAVPNTAARNANKLDKPCKVAVKGDGLPNDQRYKYRNH